MIELLVDNRDLFITGFQNTILLFILAGIGALALGTLLAAMRVSPVPALRLLGTGYVTIFRNTPLTLVFFFFAFAYPRLDLVDVSILYQGCTRAHRVHYGVCMRGGAIRYQYR